MLPAKLLILLSVCGVLEGANILLLPFANTSHYLEIDGVGRPLLARGHNVYVLMDEHTVLPKGSPYQLLTYRNPSSVALRFDTKMQHKLVESSQAGMNMSMMFEMIKNVCTSMMADEELYAKLVSLKLDLAIVDNFFAPCYFLLPYKLGVPYVGIGSLLTAWMSRLPVLPSVVQPPLGLEMFGIKYCEETDSQWGIVRRFCRLVAFAMGEAFPSFIESDYLRKYVDFPSLQEVREGVALSLVNWNYLLSTPLPKLPNVEYVGGLTTKSAKPLEASLAEWMAAASNVVVVSFGSNFGSLPPVATNKLLEAFGRLDKYNFIWRFQKEESKAYKIPANVRLMDWLPQNDVLGHNSTVAFITHSGNNGQQEALFHGVPMLCFYIFADQKNNARRVVRRGFGKMISIHEFTADDVAAELTELIENKTYSQRIKKASAIFHSDKHPSERAADAIEHLLKYGGEHLRPKEALELSFWQYYMLDIFAIIYLGAVCIIAVLVKLVCVVVRLCKRGGSKKVKAE